MMRQIPIVLGLVALVGLTVCESMLTGRFQSSNVTEEQFASFLARVPQDIGDWHGKDLPVEDQVRETAGARGYVSRAYQNTVTGESVTVWLIVGHARDIVRHTPDICYPSSGFKKRSPENSRQSFIFEGQPQADFYTNTFTREDVLGRRFERVFWAWHKPNDEGTVRWQAPKTVRWEFGNARSLYKLYFSSSMRDIKETTDQSPCVQFAEVFLPVVEKALLSSPANPAEGGSADAPAT